MSTDVLRRNLLRTRAALHYANRGRVHTMDSTAVYEANLTLLRARQAIADPAEEYRTIVALLETRAWLATKGLARFAKVASARRVEAMQLRAEALAVGGGQFAAHAEARYWAAAAVIPGLGGSLEEYQAHDATVRADLTLIASDVPPTLGGGLSSELDGFGVYRLEAVRQLDGISGLMSSASSALRSAKLARELEERPRNVLCVARCLTDLARHQEAKIMIAEYLDTETPGLYTNDVYENEAIRELKCFE